MIKAKLPDALRLSAYISLQYVHYFVGRIRRSRRSGMNKAQFASNSELRLRHKTIASYTAFSVREACALAFSAHLSSLVAGRLHRCGNGDSVPQFSQHTGNGISHFAFQMTIHLPSNCFSSSGMLWPVTAERNPAGWKRPLCSAHRSELPAAVGVSDRAFDFLHYRFRIFQQPITLLRLSSDLDIFLVGSSTTLRARQISE